MNTWTGIVSSRQISFNNAQQALTGARTDLIEAQIALSTAQIDVVEAISKAAEKLEDLIDHLQGQTIGELYDLYLAADNAWDDARDAKTAALEAFGGEPSALQIIVLNAIVTATLADKIAKDDIYANAVSAVADAADVLAGALTNTEIQVEAKVEADVDAQVGLQVKMVLDAGSVASALEYSIETTSELDALADTFSITAVATNTNGDTVAFDTISPNATFYAGIAYNIGAQFRILLDIYSKIAGATVIDFPNGTDPLELTENIRMSGWLDLIDLDSRDLSFSLDLPGWIGDILGMSFSFPTINTVGRSSPVLADVYTDPDAFDLDRLAEVLLDFANAQLDYSPEFRALLVREGENTDLTTDDFGEAFGAALRIFFKLLTGQGDTDGDGVVPLFLLKNKTGTVDGLFHIDSIADVIDEVAIDEVGSLGFFVSQGRSGDVVQVSVDIDQLVAVLVNIAFGNPPNSAVNPLDLSYGLSDILDETALSQQTKEDIQQFISLELGVEAMDLDVTAGVNFSQKFALSVDDMLFELTFEDGTMQQVRASEGGQIVVQNASGLVDTNGNGQIDYDVKLTPDATFFNDTQLGLSLGYTLDFLKAKFNAAATLPLGQIFPGLSLPGLSPSVGIDLGLGPVVRMTGNLDVLSADIFEDIFDFNAGSGSFAGAFDAPATSVPGDTHQGIADPERIIGTALADLLKGAGGNDTMSGRSGDDSLMGGAQHDNIRGGDGYDSIVAGDGDDTVWGGNGGDYVDLGRGADLFWDTAQSDQHGNDTVLGGGGNDTINGAGGNESIEGGDGADSLMGGAGDDMIDGGTGFDRIDAGIGHDTVLGGNGRDLIFLGDGADVFRDTVQTGTNGHDVVNGGKGNDRIFGGGGNETVNGGDGNDLIYGGIGNDRLNGGAGYDTIFAGSGNDTVSGGDGRDQVKLGHGADVYFDNAQTGANAHDIVDAGAGNDTVYVGGGDDTLTGGAGNDSFVFGAIASGDNTISDYVEGQDALRINTSLWGGALTQSYLDSIADDSGADLVLDFGAGGLLTLEGVATTAGLLDEITLI